MINTRKRLIDLLEERGELYTSGQMLSDRLNISRAAVWKHMKELEKDGYIIEAVSGKGYQIQSQPKKTSANTIKWGLRTDWLGKKLVHRTEVNSTQTIAHQLAMEGAENGTVVIADEQTKGKGRMGRNWYSAKDKGIWMSMILRPDLLPAEAPQLTLLAASTLAQLLKEMTGVTPEIKWPNDILINDKKVSGILTEMQAEQDRITYIVLGIGVNVNHLTNDLDKDISRLATSLKLETGKIWDIHLIIQEYLKKFEDDYHLFLTTGFQEVKKKWEKHGYKIGKNVMIMSGRQRFEAKLIGIEEDGALKIRKKDGSEQVLYSAEIDWHGGKEIEE